MIESILSICSGAKTAYDTYKMASEIIRGNPQIKLLEEIAKQNGDMKIHIERLSDKILCGTNYYPVQDVNPSRRQQVEDLREIRESLDPLQRALGEEIFSSAMILTPDKMRQAMVKNPWDVLDDIRPFNRATPHHDPAKVPIVFDDNGVRFIGWMKRGLLPVVFEVEWQTFSTPSEIIRTNNPEPVEIPRTSSPSRTVSPEQPTKPIETPSLQGFENLAGLRSEENNKGTPRTFSTMKAGKQVECTVYEKTFYINGVPLVMVYIPEGTFQMGSNDGNSDEKPVHLVEIKKPFYMGKYPVTQKQYQAITESNPSHFKGDNLPVECTSWKDAKECCEKLSKLLKQEFRLPSEAEWEYACRANSQTKWSFGDNESNLKDYAWYRENSNSKTHDVGQKKPNAFGLYDVHGNVWEWCEDGWESNYQTPRTQTAHKYYGNNKLLRGGCWDYNSENCRSSFRYSLVNGYYRTGFRLALSSFPPGLVTL